MTNNFKTPLLQVVGRYSKIQEGQNFIDESEDLHVIAIDEEENSLFVDFDSSPEWMKVSKNKDGEITIEEKYLLNPELMTYKTI